MVENIRGLKCSLDYYDLIVLLRFLSKNDWESFVPWCLLDGFDSLTNLKGFLDDFSLFEKHNIWELELQCTPPKTEPINIKTYQDFSGSPCTCYLLYFDCGYLEIYIKEKNDFQQLEEYLMNVGVQDLSTITDENDTRTQFTVG